MTWGECKLICLQTMYANEGATLVVDDSNTEYINAMAGKANEAMMQLSLAGRPVLKSVRLSVGVEESGDAALALEAGRGGYHRVSLQSVAPQFRAMQSLMLDSQGIYGNAEEYRTEGDNTLLLPNDITGVYTLWYKAYPEKVRRDTPDDTVLDVHEECASLVPIYMAAELYKDDDLALATVLRNEYEDGLQKIRAAWMESGGSGYTSTMRRNTTGWW